MVQDNKISEVTGLNSWSFVLREALSRRPRMIGCCRGSARTWTLQWHVTIFGRHPLRIFAGVTLSRFRYAHVRLIKLYISSVILTRKSLEKSLKTGRDHAPSSMHFISKVSFRSSHTAAKSKIKSYNEFRSCARQSCSNALSLSQAATWPVC